MDHPDKIAVAVEWTPKIRVRLIADDGRVIYDPLFWGNWYGTLPRHEKDRIATKTSYLNRKQCRSLWKWLQRTDPVPNRLHIQLNRDDVEKAFPS